MRRLWQLAIRNWSASPGRTSASVISVALGVFIVVAITSFYETARRAVVDEVVDRWLGRAHLSIHPPGAHWGSLQASFADRVAKVENVRHVTTRLRRHARIICPEQSDNLTPTRWLPVDAIGVDPKTQHCFYSIPNLEGRSIEPDERGVAVIDKQAAQFNDTKLGSSIVLTSHSGGPQVKLEVVGIFTNEFSTGFKPPGVYVALADMWELTDEPGTASAIDIVLHDPSVEAIAAAQSAVEQLIAETDQPHRYRVESSAATQKLLDEADRITRFLLVLAAVVALLTSFFIILTTMSTSLVKRHAQLGIMRCVGLTRTQLAVLLFLELAPLGLLGTVLGLVLGAAGALTAPQWVGHSGQAYLSFWGLVLAVASGFITTLITTSALVVHVCRISPLAALRSDATPPRRIYALIAGAIAVPLLVVHELIVGAPDQSKWLDSLFTSVGVSSLYIGYILLVPAVVVLAGPPIAWIVAPLFRLHGKLADEQFVRSPWRATGVCWVLMVGLSLIVYFGIGSEAIYAVWDFPGRLPEAFVWSRDYVPADAIQRVRELPGVAETTTLVDVDCEIVTPDVEPRSATDSILQRFFNALTRSVFVAADPQELLSMTKVSFIEGSREDVVNKLQSGGYALIPVQTSRNKDLHVGDRVTIEANGRSADFEIAGVLQSPALDLAVTAFQASSYMQLAAASVVVGTHNDLRDKFDLDVVSFLLCNLDIPDVTPPPGFNLDTLPDVADERAVARAVLDWQEHLPLESGLLADIGPELESWLALSDDVPASPESKGTLRRFARAIWSVTWRRNRLSPQQGWDLLRERLLLMKIAGTLDRPEAITGSLRRLKQMVDRSLRSAFGVLTWLPAMAFAVAAIGIGNLMMVSIQTRARQIAVLRAVGALKSQIVRMVLVESVALGLLGSVMGVALGIHEAYSDNRVSGALIGFFPEFIIPIGTVSFGIALTVATCLIAGILPAYRASRSNIVAAMQSV
ncbi:MAG: ABC transporter permease [Phycisphaerales bacterium]|nr:MAG: ABC transporter permease [Phycisphaerales bacterium]